MNAFTGVKIFSATMPAQRLALGEVLTQWLDEMRRQPGFEVVDIVVRQSSDDRFHCQSFIIFFRVKGRAR